MGVERMETIDTKTAITHIKAVEDEITELMNQLNKYYSQSMCKMPGDVKQNRRDMGKAVGHLRRAKFYLIQTLVEK